MIGTIVASVWPPSTHALTSRTEAPVSIAMKVRKRAVSSMPPWPMTRSEFSPLVSSATWHIASIGFAKITKVVSGDAATAAATTLRTIPAFVPSRSSRVMPGLRGTPEVITTTSEPSVSAQSFEPLTWLLDPVHGIACAISRARPCGRPSTMSSKTTSA